jgi:hypothetical protein
LKAGRELQDAIAVVTDSRIERAITGRQKQVATRINGCT